MMCEHRLLIDVLTNRLSRRNQISNKAKIFRDKIDLTNVRRNSLLLTGQPIDIIGYNQQDSISTRKAKRTIFPSVETMDNIEHRYNIRSSRRFHRKDSPVNTGSPKLTAFEKLENKNLLYKRILLYKQKEKPKHFHLTILNSRSLLNNNNNNSNGTGNGYSNHSVPNTKNPAVAVSASMKSSFAHTTIGMNHKVIGVRNLSSKKRINTFSNLKCHFSNIYLQKIENKSRNCPSSAKSSFALDYNNNYINYNHNNTHNNNSNNYSNGNNKDMFHIKAKKNAIPKYKEAFLNAKAIQDIY